MVPGHIIRDLLIENHFPTNVIRCDGDKYTLPTEAWIGVFKDRLLEAKNVSGRDDAALAMQGADYAFRSNAPRRFRAFKDRYRVYPFYGLAFGEVHYAGRDINFYVTRGWTGGLELRFLNPHLRQAWALRPGEPETTQSIHY